jgi:hypothetical protein
MTDFRCPHCRTALPEKAVFCAHCGRRIEGWASAPRDATPATGQGSLADGEQPTRQMTPTPSLLRALALVRRQRRPQQRSRGRPRWGLGLGMLLVAAAGGVAGFFVVRARHRPPPLVLAPGSDEADPVEPAEAPVVTAPPRPLQKLKHAHRLAATPVTVAATPAPRHAKVAPGALPHKEVATDSQSIAQQEKRQAEAARAPAPTETRGQSPPPLAMPTAPHESTTNAPPPSEGEQKQEAEAQLDADSVRLVVRHHLPQVRACYGRAFKGSSPGGTV